MSLLLSSARKRRRDEANSPAEALVEERFLTVKDMAAMLVPSLEPKELQRAMRRVRHWTNNDLISPASGKHTGTGVNRIYRVTEIPKAVILAELTACGMTVEMLDGFGSWMVEVMELTEWQQAFEDGKDFFLRFSFSPDREIVYFEACDDDEIIPFQLHRDADEPRAAVSVLVNVAAIADQLRTLA